MGQFCQKVPRDIEKEQSEYSGFFYIHRDSEQAVLNHVPKIYEQTLSVVHCQIVITAGQVYRITQSDGLSFFDCTKKEKEKYTAMKGKEKTSLYQCLNCGWPVVSAGAGTNHRNHCPNCLYSIHLDNEPGDRESDCHGRMEPIGVWVRKSGEWAIIHRCVRCGKISSNRVAADDNPMKLMALAMRPFGSMTISKNEIRDMVASMENREI